jgi:hypothetical protein
MIEAAEVYRLLQQYSLSLEADQIYFNKWRWMIPKKWLHKKY